MTLGTLDLVPYMDESGVVRWSREWVKGQVQRSAPREVEGLEEHRKFEALYKHFASQYLGAIPSFGGKEWTPKKVKLIERVLSNLADYDVPVDLFLRSQFERHKVYPKAILPSVMARLHAVKSYQIWIRQFGSPFDARRRFENGVTSLEESIKFSHDAFLYYKKSGWEDEIIFRRKAGEFSTHYLIASDSFMRVYRAHPEIVNRGKRREIEAARGEVFKDRDASKRFFALVERIKCQPKSSTLNSSPKS